jgi:hypothetical protein
MLDKVEYVGINNESYPIFCSLNVLEELQDKFESIDSFDKQLTGRKEDGSIGEISIFTLKYAFMLMLNEGAEIEEKDICFSEKEVGRLLYNYGIQNAFLKVRELISACLYGKNVTSTQNQKSTAKKAK